MICSAVSEIFQVMLAHQQLLERNEENQQEPGVRPVMLRRLSTSQPLSPSQSHDQSHDQREVEDLPSRDDLDTSPVRTDHWSKEIHQRLSDTDDIKEQIDRQFLSMSTNLHPVTTSGLTSYQQPNVQRITREEAIKRDRMKPVSIQVLVPLEEKNVAITRSKPKPPPLNLQNDVNDTGRPTLVVQQHDKHSLVEMENGDSDYEDDDLDMIVVPLNIDGLSRHDGNVQRQMLDDTKGVTVSDHLNILIPKGKSRQPIEYLQFSSQSDSHTTSFDPYSTPTVSPSRDLQYSPSDLLSLRVSNGINLCVLCIIILHIIL